jgi:hypothetical protein
MGLGDQLWVVGSGDQVTTSYNDLIEDYGSGTSIDVGTRVGGSGLWITNFTADATGVIDLLNGVGSYASAAAALGAVVDDGHGNSTLSLGSGGVIHFVGDTKEQLSVANFKIG